MALMDEIGFLDLLYSAPAQPDLWVTVMERLSDMMGGANGWLSSVNVLNGDGEGLVMRTDPKYYDLYFDYYHAINPLNNVTDAEAYFRDWRPKILTDEDWMPKDELVRTEYYNDFMAPMEVDAVAMIRLAAHGQEVSCINIGRLRKRGRFEPEELALARYLHPHLIRAYRLSETFARTRALDGNAGAVFEASPHALFLVGAGGRVARLNRTAEALIRGGMGLCVVGGRLATPNAAASARLTALVAAALWSTPRTGGWMAIELPERALPLSVTVAPVGESHADVFCRERSALVTVTDLEAFTPPPEQKLRELFGLTPAEIRLVMALIKGQGLKEAAAGLGIAVNTATVHLGRVFDKTGVNRQSALLSLMMRAVGPGDGG